MAYLEQPKRYWYWFKYALRMCFPMKNDFYGLSEALWEAVCALTSTTLKIVVRLVLLLTSLISVPVLAVLFERKNKRVMEIRANRLSEEWDGLPAQYTREEVDSVLKGEKTLEQLEKEKEAKWNS